MLIHDDNLAAEPQAPRSFHDAEDDISEAESDDITKDYETFRAITARKLYGTATPELDDEDDDDDEDFWCKGLNNAMPTKMHDTQVTPKGRDDIIEEWIRDCTANLSVR